MKLKSPTLKFNNIYEDFVFGTIKSKFETDLKYLGQSSKCNLIDHVYLVTISYKFYKCSSNYLTGNYIHAFNEKFDEFHQYCCKNIISGNYVRKKYQQPFCWVFLDVSGSKYPSLMNENRLSENPHPHVIVLLHPGTKPSWDNINTDLQWQLFARNSSLILEVNVQKITDTSDIKNVVNYNRKFLQHQTLNLKFACTLDDILPRTNEGELGYPSIFNGDYRTTTTQRLHSSIGYLTPNEFSQQTKKISMGKLAA